MSCKLNKHIFSLTWHNIEYIDISFATLQKVVIYKVLKYT